MNNLSVPRWAVLQKEIVQAGGQVMIDIQYLVSLSSLPLHHRLKDNVDPKASDRLYEFVPVDL